VDRLFLDANVLFSAAYRADSGLLRLWDLPDTELVTSWYAVAEARRNLATSEQRERLEQLLERVRLIGTPEKPKNPSDLSISQIPTKDRPILLAAVAARCTHLLTGDRQHFGHLFGTSIAGVLILRPAEYLAAREPFHQQDPR